MTTSRLSTVDINRPIIEERSLYNDIPYELFTQIFSNLTIYEMHNAPRVCRNWKACSEPILFKRFENIVKNYFSKYTISNVFNSYSLKADQVKGERIKMHSALNLLFNLHLFGHIETMVSLLLLEIYDVNEIRSLVEGVSPQELVCLIESAPLPRWSYVPYLKRLDTAVCLLLKEGFHGKTKALMEEVNRKLDPRNELCCLQLGVNPGVETSLLNHRRWGSNSQMVAPKLQEADKEKIVSEIREMIEQRNVNGVNDLLPRFEWKEQKELLDQAMSEIPSGQLAGVFLRFIESEDSNNWVSSTVFKSFVDAFAKAFGIDETRKLIDSVASSDHKDKMLGQLVEFIQNTTGDLETALRYAEEIEEYAFQVFTFGGIVGSYAAAGDLAKALELDKEKCEYDCGSIIAEALVESDQFDKALDFLRFYEGDYENKSDPDSFRIDIIKKMIIKKFDIQLMLGVAWRVHDCVLRTKALALVGEEIGNRSGYNEMIKFLQYNSAEFYVDHFRMDLFLENIKLQTGYFFKS